MAGKLETAVKQLLTPERWFHTRRVVEAALQLLLAHQTGIAPERVETAALLHDCAKDMPLAVQLKKARDFGIVLTSSDLLCPQTLHGQVGAGMARHEFGIMDKEIIQAIALHTTGGPGMSPLAKVIFVADYIEQGRVFPGVEGLRVLAARDLNETVLACMDQTLKHLWQRRGIIHPRMIAARNYILVSRRCPTKKRGVR